MCGNSKILAVIPARGGSKRLPRKNVLSLQGTPLIGWTIEAAIKSGIFDAVVVSTDDDEIAEISRQFNAETPFIRPKYLAEDESSTADVVTHLLNWYQGNGIIFKDVALLQPTSPFRNEDDIKNAFKLYYQEAVNGVVSVCEVSHPPAWTNTLPASMLFDGFLSDANINKRSQDLPTYYQLNGAIYIAKAKDILEYGSLFGSEGIYAYVMSRESSIDIDNAVDFEFAEFIAHRR